jgi:hypothetical protein
MATKNVFPVTTRLRKNGPKHSTVLTVDYSGVDIGDGSLIPDAEKSMVITWQNQKRRAGVIPKSDTILVKSFVSGQRTAHVDPADVIAGMDDAALTRAYNAEMKRRADAKSAAAKPGKRKLGKRHPAQPTAQPTGTTVPPVDVPGNGPEQRG